METMVSYFLSYTDKTPKMRSMAEVVEDIRHNGLIIKNTDEYRRMTAASNAIAAKRAKCGTPCFAVAARFKADGKGRDDIEAFTGMSLVDLDHVPEEKLAEAWRMVIEDRHTLMAYTTISGKGLRVIFRIEGFEGVEPTNAAKRNYPKIFAVGNGYYEKLTGCETDRQCKNATRLSGLAHDPNVYYNPEAEPFVLEQEPVKQKETKGRRVSDLLIDTIHRELAAEGVEYVEHHHNEYVMRMGYMMNSFGVSLNSAISWATNEFADYDGDVAGIIRSCYQHEDEFGKRPWPRKRQNKGDDDTKYASVAEIEEFLRTQGVFRFNVITGKTEFSFTI